MDLFHKKNFNLYDDNDIEGKYLFFSKDKLALSTIAIDEILNNGFCTAKISSKAERNNEHVLCLYYKDDSRKYELAKKYRNHKHIKYRYWKSDNSTREGIYSLDFLKESEYKNWNKIKCPCCNYEFGLLSDIIPFIHCPKCKEIIIINEEYY